MRSCSDTEFGPVRFGVKKTSYFVLGYINNSLHLARKYARIFVR